MTVHLFDVSHWNASVDFAAAKRAGYVGVYLKATDGCNVDPTFAGRVVAAKKAGLHVGAYLFFRPALDVTQQVERFVKTVGHSLTLRAAVDHETTAGTFPARDALAANLACTWLTTDLGYKPLLYTYPDFIDQGRCKGLGSYPLWLANYSPDPAVKPPAVWTTWVMRQTGQKPVPGVTAGDGPGVDVDVAPSLTPLLIPGKSTTPKADEMTPDDWKTMGGVIDAAVNKAITHTRNGPGYNLATMQQELAELKLSVAAIQEGLQHVGGYGA